MRAASFYWTLPAATAPPDGGSLHRRTDALTANRQLLMTVRRHRRVDIRRLIAARF